MRCEVGQPPLDGLVFGVCERQRVERVFALVVVMMLATGLSALLTIGRQEDPTITNLFASVITPYPGADPSRVEALVTEKIETQLKEIPEISEITSVSRSGISVVQVELTQFITDQKIEQTWSEIRDALSDAAREFPPGVAQPEFDKPEWSWTHELDDEGFLLFTYLTHDYNEGDLTRAELQDTVYTLNILMILPAMTVPEGELELYLKFGFSNSASDFDNPVKCFVDCLQKKYGFNDKMIKRCLIEVEKVKKGGEFIEFEIKEMEK